MYALATTLALLIATAGWHYLFYSPRARAIVTASNVRHTQPPAHTILRRAGGAVAAGPRA